MNVTFNAKLHTAQKIKLPIKNFFSKCDQIRSQSADLVTFTGEIFSFCAVTNIAH